MSLSKQQRAFSKDVILLMQFINNQGIEVTFGEAFRTNEQQQLHLKNGRSKIKHSKHQDRLAIDFNFFINGEYKTDKKSLQKIGDFWESLNPLNKWGGNWKSFVDTPHFERKRI